jgi:ubiquinone/menaquinone biosynthesis C-methylase UbiE
VEVLRKFCPGWRDKKVLEIGCGTGRITESLARWGAHVTATDISKEMLQVARDRLNSQADVPTPEFRVMSVFECDLDLRSYDYIVMVNVLGRLSDSARAIREIVSRWYRPKTIRSYCLAAGLEIVKFRGNHYVPVPRLLFPTLPFFWACDHVIGRVFPRRCPSVFVECRIDEHGPSR